MSILDRYRLMYEHEKDSNQKMLAMIESVPEANRTDARFLQALSLADHMAAGREKWLDYMAGDGKNEISWRNEYVELSTLRPRFAAVEKQWTDYLASLEESRLAEDFDFVNEENGQHFPWRIETIIIQMIGHAPYHRGQVAMLVDQLGGETVDTDYAGWWWWNVKEKA